MAPHSTYSESTQVNGFTKVDYNGRRQSLQESAGLQESMSRVNKTSILRERTNRTASAVKKQLGNSSDMFLERIESFEGFLEALAEERLRFMPQDGSRWDKVIRWAEGFAAYIYMLHQSVHSIMSHSDDASQMIWSSVLALLQLGPNQVTVLTKVFSVLHQLGTSMAGFLRQTALITMRMEIQKELAFAYSDLMELTCAISTHYVTQGQGELDSTSANFLWLNRPETDTGEAADRKSNIEVGDFQAEFGQLINAFLAHKSAISELIWVTQIEGAFGDAVSMSEIRHFLEPSDRKVTRISRSRFASGEVRAEFTCEWLSSSLNEFLRRNNKVLLVTGAPGCGKTFLADWIVETLRGGPEQNSYDVIHYRVDSDIPTTTNSLTLIKNLLLQLLDAHLGSQACITHIDKAMKMAQKGNTAHEVEMELWKGLHIDSSETQVVLVIDGLDQLHGGQRTATAILERLNGSGNKNGHTGFKAVVLSRPMQKAAPSLTTHLAIQEGQTAEDIELFIDAQLNNCPQFSGLTEQDKSSITRKVVERARGSFLWAEFAFHGLRQKQTLSEITAHLDTSPSTIEAFIEKIVANLDLTKTENKQILSWILAAERPLEVEEIKALLEIDVEQCTRSARFISDFAGDIRRMYSPLITVRDDFVYMRHASLRHHLITSKMQKFDLDWKKTHTALALRCLAYTKLNLSEDAEISFRPMSLDNVYIIFDQHLLMEYAVRHWWKHFQASTLHSEDGRITSPSSLKASMPVSVFMAQLESACIMHTTVARDADEPQLLAYNVRQRVLGSESAACLQSLVYFVSNCQKISSKRLMDYSYEAWRISRSVAHVTVAVACAEAFIESTMAVSMTKRTEAVVHKEKVLEYLIQTHKRIHGASHETTIKYTKVLADLYVLIHESERAVSLFRELYEINIERHGYFHEETTKTYELLITQLKTLSKFDVILDITRTYYDYVLRTLSITDERRVKATKTLVKMYEERHETSKAEEILVSYWRHVTTSASVSLETKIDVAIEYSKFLTRHNRREESELILRGVWTEVQSFTEQKHSETLIKRVKMIAEEFRSLRVFSMARSVLNSLWSYCKTTGESNSNIAMEVASFLAETVTEMMTISTTAITERRSSITETRLLSIEEEMTLKEAFDTTISMSSATSSALVTSSIVKTCEALATNYARTERYSEAVDIYSKTFHKIWSSLETANASAAQKTAHHSEDVIETAMSFGYCRFQMLQIESAITIYKNVFHALVGSGTKCAHSFVVRLAGDVIKFFETIYRFEYALDTYRQLATHLKATLGKTHDVTLEILSAYGLLARRLSNLSLAEEVYFEIYQANRTPDNCIKADGLENALVLCEIYEKSERWELARPIYASLWDTFLKHGAQYKLDFEFVERIYERYMFVLEHKTKAEYTVIRQVAVDYRSACVSFYGVSSEVTMKATIHLAQICEQSETHSEEAIALYEEVLQYSEKMAKSSSASIRSAESTSSGISTRTITETVKRRLAEMYSASTTTTTKAVSIYHEHFETTKATYGYASLETSSALHDLALAYKKQNTQEATRKATSALHTAVIDVFKQKNTSEERVEVIQNIARTYIECGYKDQATKVVHELRQMVVEEARSTARTEKSSYTLFAAFAETVMESSSFSSIVSEIRSEIILYEAYFEAVNAQVSVLVIFECGARLRMFLQEVKRTQEMKRIESELHDIFVKQLAASLAVSKQAIQAMFTVCMECIVQENAETIILDRAIDDVLSSTNASKFQHAYDMGLLIHRFVHYIGGFNTLHHIQSSFGLCLYLAGRRTKVCSDPKLYQAMLEQSKLVLREALAGALSIGVSFAEMDISYLNEIVVLLGEQQNYEDLEAILNNLWSCRIVQKTWSPTTVVWIGRRLVETRFSGGRHDAAIHLCEDIRYNLTRVWGALDPTTLDVTLLLSEMYTERQQFRKAMALHEDVLSHLAYDEDEDLRQCETEPVSVALTQLEYLKRCHQRLGAWDKSEQSYRDLFADLSHRFGAVKAWKDKSPQAIEKWPSKGADAFGYWRKPDSFGFVFEDDSSADQKKKARMLRRTSTSLNLLQRRLSTPFAQIQGPGSQGQVVQ